MESEKTYTLKEKVNRSLPAGEQNSNGDPVALPSQCWLSPNPLFTRSTIVNLYLLGEAVGIKEDRQHNVILIAKSYPLNKTSKNIPRFFEHHWC